MQVSLNGVYVTSYTDEVASYLESMANPNEVLQFESVASHNLYHLPIPQPFSPPEIVPNVLRWPTSASRFATLFLVIDDEDMATLRSSFSATGPTAVALFVDGEDVDDDLSINMYMLPPRPLAPLAIMGANGLWLLPLVDERYFWWFKGASIVKTTDFTTWETLFSSIATALGVSITVSTVSADYGTPGDRFTTYYQPLPLLLDAAAYTIGMRFVAKIDGTYLVQSYSDAKTVQDAEVALIGTRSPLSGGSFRIGEVKRSVPDTVVVVFPKTDDGVASDVPYAKTVTLASLALTEYTASGSISDATYTTPILVTTSGSHGLASGDVVTIASVGGNTAANGTWAVTVVNTTMFTLDMSVGNGDYTSGGTWTATVTGFNGEKVIMGDKVATLTTAGGATPTNDADLIAYTAKAATDWYHWEIYDGDFQFGGIVDWTINGNVDQIEWYLTKTRATTRVSCGAYNDITWGTQLQADDGGGAGGSGVYGQADTLPIPAYGPRSIVNLIPDATFPAVGQNFQITILDNAVDDSLDWTLTNLGMFVRINSTGSTYGPEPRLNFIRAEPTIGNNLSISAADDAGDEEVDVTFDNLGVFGRANTIPTPYSFSTSLTTPPSSGEIRANDATAALTTELYMSKLMTGGATNTYVDALRTNSIIDLADASNPLTYARYTLDSVTDSGTYYTIGVTYDSGSLLPDATASLINFPNDYTTTYGPRRRINVVSYGGILASVQDNAADDELIFTIGIDYPSFDFAGGLTKGPNYAVLGYSTTDAIRFRNDPEVVSLIARSSVDIGIPTAISGTLDFWNAVDATGFTIHAGNNTENQSLSLPTIMPTTVRKFLMVDSIPVANQTFSEWKGLYARPEAYVAQVIEPGGLENWRHILFTDDLFVIRRDASEGYDAPLVDLKGSAQDSAVLWTSSASSRPQWTRNPNVWGLVLGTSLTRYGILDFANAVNSYQFTITADTLLGADQEMRLPTTAPSAGGFLIVSSIVSGDLYQTEWATMSGDATMSSGGAITIASNAVTFAKMQAVSANILLGNDGSGTAVEEISLGTSLAIAASTLDVATVDGGTF